MKPVLELNNSDNEITIAPEPAISGYEADDRWTYMSPNRKPYKMPKVKTMRCLVTGGTGFVGQNLVRRLLDDGHNVVVHAHKSHAIPHGAITFDAAPCWGFDEYIKHINPEWVFHLAASGTRPSHTNQEMVNANILYTRHLLDAVKDCKDLKRFVHTGASQEYGLRYIPMGEEHTLYPNTFYGVTKATATLMCQQYRMEHGLPAVTLRLFSGYGPHEHPDRLIPKLIELGRENKLPPLVDPKSARDYIYIGDIVNAIMKAAKIREDFLPYILNIGTGVQRTLEEVVDTARKVLGVTAEPEWNTMDKCQFDTRTWVSGTKLARDVLRWEPEHDFESGFRKTVEWYESNP